MDLRVGYGLNSIVTPYLGGAYADIRSPGLEAIDRVTFAHVDLGVRLHLAAGRRRWVLYGDLALTFWQVTDVVKNGEETATDFTSMPTFSVGRGLGPVNTYLSASKMSTKWMKPMNITSSFSNRENIRR